MLKPLISPEEALKHYFRAYKGQGFLWQYIAATSGALFLFAMFYLWVPIILGLELHASHAFSYHPLNIALNLGHIALSSIPIVVGPWLFHGDFRRKRPDLHRKLGYAYVIGCLAGAVSVFPLALNNGAWIGRLGFSVMAVMWFFITYFAYTSAVRGQFVSHRRWMMRSYAMTYAFVHVNFTYKILGIADFEGAALKAFQSTISWMFNLMIVELYLAATAPNGRWLGAKAWTRNLMCPFNSQDKMYFGPIIPYRRNKDKRS